MANSVADIETKLKSGIDQRWLCNEDNDRHKDRYGNEIYKTGGKYILYRKQVKIVEVNRLHTAKLISTILLNDVILYKDLG